MNSKKSSARPFKLGMEIWRSGGGSLKTEIVFYVKNIRKAKEEGKRLLSEQREKHHPDTIDMTELSMIVTYREADLTS